MLSCSDAVGRFLAALRSRQAPATTVKAYSGDLRRFVAFFPDGALPMQPEQFRGFLSSEPQLSAGTRRRRYATLCAFYRWLHRQELIASNPMLQVETVKVPTRLPRPLASSTVGQILKAITATATRDRAFFTLLYETGMRVGEALGIQYTDLDLTPDDEKILVFGKGQRERTVLLTAAPESIRLLRRHLRASGIRAGSLFRGDPRYGGSNLPMDYTTVRRAWQHYCSEAKVQATIHQLRHSRASQMVQAGVPLTTVRKLLGHRNIQTTLLYVELGSETIKHDLLDYQRRKKQR